MTENASLATSEWIVGDVVNGHRLTPTGWVATTEYQAETADRIRNQWILFGLAALGVPVVFWAGVVSLVRLRRARARYGETVVWAKDALPLLTAGAASVALFLMILVGVGAAVLASMTPTSASSQQPSNAETAVESQVIGYWTGLTVDQMREHCEAYEASPSAMRQTAVTQWTASGYADATRFWEALEPVLIRKC